MKYYLCQTINLTVTDKKTKIQKVIGTKNIKLSEHASERALDITFEKSRAKNIYKVVVPDTFYVGLLLYNQQKLVGEIVKETKDIWYIKRLNDKELIDYMLIKKENMEQKFIDKYFIVKEKVDEQEY